MNNYNDHYNYNYRRKQPKGRSLFSYFIVALIGAIVGGIFTSYIAPTYLYGKILPMPEMLIREEKGPINQISISSVEDISIVSAVAKKAIGSVVGITTIQEIRELFWSRDVPGVGSGLIIHPNGYILTNSHVIGDGQAKSINVLIENGDKLSGRVLWFDPALDLAIVKVEANGLQVADLGDSDILEVGEPAIAIGNPLGLEFQRSVTSGVISGLHRSIRVSEKNVIDDLIQTDASINPGNSGGPLLNKNGEVIGINTAKIKTGEGLGFAIPINIVKPIAEEVIKEGSFSNVYIGFEGAEIREFERYYGTRLKVDSGIVVLEVFPNSPGANANLKPLDIIRKIDNKEIYNMVDLRKSLYKYKIGDKAILTVNRNGKDIKIEITFSRF